MTLLVLRTSKPGTVAYSRQPDYRHVRVLRERSSVDGCKYFAYNGALRKYTVDGVRLGDGLLTRLRI